MARSIDELVEICEGYPYDYEGDDKTAVVNEFISILESNRGDFCDCSLLWRLSNEEQKKKLLPIAVSLSQSSSDIDEIISHYCPEREGPLFQELMIKRSSLPLDGDADI